MLIERGYTARTIPREYGGHGGEMDILKSRIIAEEFAQAQVPGGLGGQGISMLVPTLLEMGTEEQKRQFIPPTLRGEMIWCQGYSEPERRQRPREPAHERRARRRRLGRQRSEDLDQHRAVRRLDLLPGAHRAECAETSRHQLPAVFDEDTRHRSAPAEDDDGRCDVQRSVLHERARAERSDRRAARRRLARRELDPATRTQFARRPEHHADAAERVDRVDEDRNASTAAG